MVEKATFRDRIYFVSDGNAAAALGVSRHIIRAKKRLEERGDIIRQGKCKIGPCKATVVYSFHPHRRRLPQSGKHHRRAHERMFRGVEMATAHLLKKK